MAAQGVQIRRPELLAQRDAFAQALAGELSARLGRSFSLSGSEPQRVGVLELVESDDPIARQSLRFSGTESGLHVLLPRRDAALLAALEQGASGEAVAAALDADLDDAAVAALKQVMESLVDVMQRSFASAGLAGLSVGDARIVATPQSDPTWMDDTFYLRLRFSLAAEGFEAGRLDLVLCERDLVGEVSREASICFITVGEADRKRISEIEASLDANAVTLDPRELAKPLDERVLEARAIVIPWDLAGRSGLELTESLARDPRLARISILVASPRPTRAQLLAALRAGATRLILDPFDVDSIRTATTPTKEVAS